jgi:soluble lytic murein transglycosylase-like protein
MRLPALIGLAVLALSGAVLADCIEKAAATFGTNPDVLRAIAIVESKVRPQAVNVNPNGSVDRGMFQINSIHLPELAQAGIGPEDLHDVCLSSNVAALLLKRKMKVFGDTWAAVGAYHSTIPEKGERYVRKVRTVFDGMQRLRITAQVQ